MKKNRKNLIVLGVAAHPDDLDFGAAGTFAKWTKTGHNCYYLICTDGSKGSDDYRMTAEKLIKIRRREQMEAGKLLGLKNVFFLNYKDTELEPTMQLKKDITRYIRMLKPDILVSFDPAYVYSVSRNFINHTDHRAASLAAMDAVFPLARDRLTFPELQYEGLEPHKVKELYFVNFENYNEIVDISDTIDIKLKALSRHKTQVNNQALKRMKKLAREKGEKHGFLYAETFIKITLP